MLKLYNYFRSSAAYRVRIALNLKGLPYEYLAVHLTRDGGEQLSAAYRAISPDAVVPTLQDGEAFIQQSLAICEYLDETHPEPPLLPGSALDRAYVRSLALTIACEIHPLNNLRVLKYLKHSVGASEDAKNAWYRHWVEQGLASVEALLARGGKAGQHCLGDLPTLADACLVPQIFNAQRFDCRLDHVPQVMRIFEHCMALDAFANAAPARQPDAE